MLLQLLRGCSQGRYFYLFSLCTAKFQLFQTGREGVGGGHCEGGLAPLSGNTRNFLLPSAFAHTLLGEPGVQQNQGTAGCHEAGSYLSDRLPVPFNEVQLRLVPLAQEQISAVVKDIFNLVWPEEESAVQLDVIVCKTHTPSQGCPVCQQEDRG